jgi:hypothetical protein
MYVCMYIHTNIRKTRAGHQGEPCPCCFAQMTVPDERCFNGRACVCVCVCVFVCVCVCLCVCDQTKDVSTDAPVCVCVCVFAYIYSITYT